jgi:type I restriction enzyme, R subunit
VVWHTQGSGKSLTMAFYAGRVVLHPAMENPTLVVITDRNDLDDQLFGTFAAATSCCASSRCRPRAGPPAELLHDRPPRAAWSSPRSRSSSRPRARTSYPLLSDRRNIVVIADEAHRSQYDFIDGFARHMRDALPNASFIGFTGTPIELTDNTAPSSATTSAHLRHPAGGEDGATVPIYYESRLAKLELDERREARSWTRVRGDHRGRGGRAQGEAQDQVGAAGGLVGAEKRSADRRGPGRALRARLEAMDGKAMIVCMSRRICVELYNAIVACAPTGTPRRRQG